MSDMNERLETGTSHEGGNRGGWFSGVVTLEDGTRLAVYDPTTDSVEEVTAKVQSEYDASDPIVSLAQEIAPQLGITAKKLLEMAALKISQATDTTHP